MSMDRIKGAIIEEAEEKAREIKSEARARCEERLEQGKEEMEQEFENKFKEARQKVERRCERRVIQDRSKHNLKLLARRNEILDQLFEDAARRIYDLPQKEYQSLISTWMKGIPADVSGTVLCHEGDRERVEPVVEELNEDRSDDAQLELKEGDQPESGGVVFQSDKFEMDLSVDTRINDLRESLAPRIAEEVFPGGLKV